MNKQDPQSKNLKKIVELAASSLEIDVLWLYGSRARNNANKNSDYDLAVAFKSYTKDPVDRRLRPELLALEWNKQLDIMLSIVDINLAMLPLAYTVVKDNSAIYIKNDYRKMTEEQKIMSKWELDYMYHRKHYA
jgi:predicted nucleotidyltransferase